MSAHMTPEQVRSKIDHPIVDGDGHWVEYDPVVSDKELLGRVTSIERDEKCIRPSTRLSFSQRLVAGLVRSSDFAARIIVGMHGLAENKARS